MALNVLIRSDLGVFFGLSAIIGISVAALLFVVGVRRRRRPIRRVVWLSTAAIGALTALAIAGFAVSGSSARAALATGSAWRERASPSSATATSRRPRPSSPRRGTCSLTPTRASIARGRACPGSCPSIAQNADAITDLADAAAASTTQLGTSVGQIDPDSLRLVDGRVDLAAVEAVAAPLRQVQASLDDLGATVTSTDSPWLLQAVQSRVQTLADDIDTNEPRLANAVNAAQSIPKMLGSEGPRRYLFIFTTPAEARGLGGFMGNFAEIEANDGQLTMTKFGRTADLNNGGPDPTARVVTGPEDWLNQWGRYGFRNGLTGTTARDSWENITMSPALPRHRASCRRALPAERRRPARRCLRARPVRHRRPARGHRSDPDPGHRPGLGLVERRRVPAQGPVRHRGSTGPR